MTYINYPYGNNKKEIRALLNKRLALRVKIRKAKSKLEDYAKREQEIEKQIDYLLSLSTQQ